MAWQYHPLLVLFALGGFVSLGVAGYCWQYVRARGWSYLVGSIGLLGFSNAIWVFAATLKTASTDLQTSLLFYKIEFLGLLPGTAVAIVVALAYVGRDRWLTRRTLALLGAVPAVFVLLAVSNPAEVMIVDPKLIPAQGVLAFEHEFPPLFSLYLAWIYGAILLAVLIIAWGLATDRIPTGPAVMGVLALLFPLVTGVLKTAGVYPPGGKGVNVSPAASTIGISVLAFAIIRHRVFEVVPIGRDRAIEVMADGFLFVGPNGMILDANPAAADLLGEDSSAGLQAIPVNDLVPVYDGVTEGHPLDLETGGRIVEVRQSDATRQGQDAGEVLLLHDVTEQRRQKRELERTNERLDRFASVVSHDLVNPLHVAKGNLELAREDNDGERLAAASDALERMETLIDDLLTLARKGDSISDTERVSLSAVVNDCWTVIDSGGATLTIEDDRTLTADSDRLQQLLENLFRNAVEHGSTGGRTESDDAIEHGGTAVTIRVGALPDATGFYVGDDGPGIPVDERDDVFEYGYSTTESGTGFGLGIVQEIVDAHGWNISVTESADEGARFEVTGVNGG